jgi:hypothetical protein
MFNAEDDKPIRPYKRRNLKASYKDNTAYQLEYYNLILSKRNAKRAEFNRRQRSNLSKAKENTIIINQKIFHISVAIKQLDKIIAKKLSAKNKLERGLILHTKRKDGNLRYVEKLKNIVSKLNPVNKHNICEVKKSNEKTNI